MDKEKVANTYHQGATGMYEDMTTGTNHSPFFQIFFVKIIVGGKKFQETNSIAGIHKLR